MESAPETDSATRSLSRSALDVLQTDAERTRMRLTLTGVDVELANAGGVVRHDARFEGSVSRGEAGLPDVPVLRQLVAIPDCRQIELHVTIASETELNGIDLRPAPGMRRDSEGRVVEVYEEDPVVYEKDEDFPGDVLRVVSLGYLRGQRLALVEIAPVQYNPVRQRLRVINDVTVEIRTVDPMGALFRPVGPMDALLSGIVVNARQEGPFGAPPSGGPLMTGGAGEYQWCDGSTVAAVAQSVNQFGADYLIVVAEEVATPPADTTLIDQLADRRADYNGFNVAIVRVDQIDGSPNTTSTPDSIRNLIKTVFDAQSATHMGDGRLGYVLLLGDAWNPAGDVLLPCYYGYPEVAGETTCSDAYYSLLDDDPHTDPFPDIFIGRLPVDADENDWEMDNVVSKILAYEPLPADTNTTWPDKILMVSGNLLTGPQGEEFFGDVTDNAVPPGKTVSEIHREYEDGEEECSALIAETLSDGYWFTSFIGHGTPFYMAETFYQKHFDVLQNSALPVMSFYACDIGQFDFNADSIDVYCKDSPGYGCTDEGYPASNLWCYKPPSDLDGCDAGAERLVLQPNGAIATFAYTREQVVAYAENDFYYLYRTYSQENASTLGDLLLGVKLLSSNYILLYIYTLFGDPALNIRWKDVVHDSVDVTIRSSDIRGRHHTKYIGSGQSDDLVVTFRNLGMKDADDVSFEIWVGDPSDQQSTRLDSLTIDNIPAHGEYTGEYPVTLSNPGLYPIYVKLDPVDEIAERAEDNNVAGALLAALPYHGSGFPVKTGVVHHYHPACVRDVTGHPGQEILVTSTTDIRCYGEDGSRRWSFKRQDGNGNDIKKQKGSPVVTNIMKDGDQYVLFEAGEPSHVYLLHGPDGSVADSIAIGDSSGTYTGMGHGVGDFVAGDASLEIVTFDDRDFVGYQVDGTELWRRQTEISPTPVYNRWSAIAVADVNNDGNVEVVLAHYNEHGHAVLEVIEFEGSEISNVTTKEIGWVYPLHPHEVCVFDGDDDGDLEILVYGESNGYNLQLYHHGLSTPIWSYPVESEPYFSVGDINADGDIEIVVVSEDNIRVLSSGGQLLQSATLSIGNFVSTPLLVDIDGDSKCEIVTNSVNSGDHVIGVIRVYDSDLNAMGDTLSYFADTLRAPGPAMGDLDYDGTPELAFVSADSVLHVVDLGSSMGVAEWPQSYNNAMNTNVYAQPIVGEYNNAVSLFNRVHVIGDVVFREDLYVAPGSDIRVWIDSVAVFQSFKEFHAEGTKNYPIQFAAWNHQGFSSDTDDWVGVSIEDDSTTASGSFNYCTIKNAINGIDSESNASIRNSTIELCDLTGIKIAGTDSTYLHNTTIQDCDIGIHISLGDSTSVKADIDSCFIYDNDYGISVYNTSEVTIKDCDLDYNTTDGIYCDGADVSIEQSSIQHSAVGIYCYDHSDPTIKINSIKNNSTGIMCDDDSDGFIEDNEIVYNGTGVAATNDAYPDLGHDGGGGGWSSGLNEIHNNSGFHVANFTVGLTINAEANYWKGKEPLCFPKQSKIYGSVDYSHALCGDSSSASSPFVRREEPDNLPVGFNLGQNFPNPFNPTTTLRYDVPPPGGRVSIVVFNVRGQRVATVVDGIKPPGYHRVTWDGANDHGIKVASGVYFVQMRAPRYSQTKKLVLLK
jgi:hypothetical protein